MRYFIPPKLNRGFKIGPYSMIDAFVLMLLTLVSLSFAIRLKSTIVLIPLAILLVIRIKTNDNRTVGKKAMQRTKFLLNQNKYELRGCFNEEKSSKND